MMHRFLLFLCIFSVSACSETSAVAPKTVTTAATTAAPVVAKTETEIETADFVPAIRSLVRHLVKSGVLDNDVQNKIQVTRLVNRTPREFDLTQLKKDIQTTVRATKKATVVTTGSRPDLTLSGKITYRIAHVRGKKRTEYYLHMILSDARTGVNLWENDSVVLKRKQKR